MKNKNSVFILLFFYILMAGCKNIATQCLDSKIIIENRWYEENDGLNNLEVKDEKDILFICNRIKNFPEGKDVRVSYNHGYLDIFFNDLKLNMIFTVNNGVVYSVGVGRYVYDEELTARIIKIMEIKKRCWGKDCE